jgi:hypothetical protein
MSRGTFQVRQRAVSEKVGLIATLLYLYNRWNDKLDVWKHELNMKRLTVIGIYNYTLQSVLRL